MRYVIWNRRGCLDQHSLTQWPAERRIRNWSACPHAEKPGRKSCSPNPCHLLPPSCSGSKLRCRVFLLSLFKTNEKIWPPSWEARTAPGQLQPLRQAHRSLPAMGHCPSPHSPYPPKSIHRKERVWPAPSLLEPPCRPTTAVCKTLRMSNRLSSPFHRDNSAKQPLIMKTNSVITFPQNHFSSAFCFSFSSFSYWWVSPSPAISKNDSVVAFSFGKCSPGNTVSRQCKRVSPKHIRRNWMNLTIWNKSVQKHDSGESCKKGG